MNLLAKKPILAEQLCLRQRCAHRKFDERHFRLYAAKRGSRPRTRVTVGVLHCMPQLRAGDVRLGETPCGGVRRRLERPRKRPLNPNKQGITQNLTGPADALNRPRRRRGPAYDGDGEPRDGADVAELTGLLNLTGSPGPRRCRQPGRCEWPNPRRCACGCSPSPGACRIRAANPATAGPALRLPDPG